MSERVHDSDAAESLLSFARSGNSGARRPDSRNSAQGRNDMRLFEDGAPLDSNRDALLAPPVSPVSGAASARRVRWTMERSHSPPSLRAGQDGDAESMGSMTTGASNITGAGSDYSGARKGKRRTAILASTTSGAEHSRADQEGRVRVEGQRSGRRRRRRRTQSRHVSFADGELAERSEGVDDIFSGVVEGRRGNSSVGTSSVGGFLTGESDFGALLPPLLPSESEERHSHHHRGTMLPTLASSSSLGLGLRASVASSSSAPASPRGGSGDGGEVTGWNLGRRNVRIETEEALAARAAAAFEAALPREPTSHVHDDTAVVRHRDDDDDDVLSDAGEAASVSAVAVPVSATNAAAAPAALEALLARNDVAIGARMDGPESIIGARDVARIVREGQSTPTRPLRPNLTPRLIEAVQRDLDALAQAKTMLLQAQSQTQADIHTLHTLRENARNDPETQFDNLLAEVILPPHRAIPTVPPVPAASLHHIAQLLQGDTPLPAGSKRKL